MPLREVRGEHDRGIKGVLKRYHDSSCTEICGESHGNGKSQKKRNHSEDDPSRQDNGRGASAWMGRTTLSHGQLRHRVPDEGSALFGLGKQG